MQLEVRVWDYRASQSYGSEELVSLDEQHLRHQLISKQPLHHYYQLDYLDD